MDVSITEMDGHKLKNIESKQYNISLFIMVLFSIILTLAFILAPSSVARGLIEIGQEGNNALFAGFMYFVLFVTMGVALVGYNIVITISNSSERTTKHLYTVFRTAIGNPIILLFAMVGVPVFMLFVGWHLFGVNGVDFESPMDQMVVGLLSFFGFMAVFLLRKKITGGVD